MTGRRLVPVGDVELCVEDFGDPADPTILLVAGAAAAMDWWDVGLCRLLADGGRHVVRYDHRDTGESTTGIPDFPQYDGWQLGRDCEGLIRALGTGPVHLAGLSMGGGIAQQVALQHPELVATLTLMSTSAVGGVDWGTLPGPTAAVRASFESSPAKPDWDDADAYVDWVIACNTPFCGSVRTSEERMREIAREIHARSEDVAAANNHWLVAGGDGGEDSEPLDVHHLAAPTLVVHGSEDPLFPLPHGEALAAAVPDAALVVLPGVGHEVPPEQTWPTLTPALLAHTAVPTAG